MRSLHTWSCGSQSKTNAVESHDSGQTLKEADDPEHPERGGQHLSVLPVLNQSVFYDIRRLRQLLDYTSCNLLWRESDERQLSYITVHPGESEKWSEDIHRMIDVGVILNIL